MQVQPSIRYLLEAARWAPSADNSQPWRLRWSESALTIGYDTARVAGTTFAANDPATLLSMGAVLENLLQAAEAVGFTVQLSRSSPPGYVTLNLLGSTPSRDGPADHPLFLRHTNRLSFRKDPLPVPLRDEVRRLSEAEAEIALVDNQQSIAGVARLVRSASEIRFRTREITEWLARSLRFTPRDAESGDGLDIATLNLPPGGTGLLRVISNWKRMEALNRWGAYRLLAAIEANVIGNASALVAVTGAGGPGGAIDAGRLMERTWILLNQRGLAVHPYYVISDQLFRRERKALPPGLERDGDILAKETESALRLSLSGRKLYMLLRVGYPRRAPARSKRLPLSAISDPETES